MLKIPSQAFPLFSSFWLLTRGALTRQTQENPLALITGIIHKQVRPAVKVPREDILRIHSEPRHLNNIYEVQSFLGSIVVFICYVSPACSVVPHVPRGTGSLRDSCSQTVSGSHSLPTHSVLRDSSIILSCPRSAREWAQTAESPTLLMFLLPPFPLYPFTACPPSAQRSLREWWTQSHYKTSGPSNLSLILEFLLQKLRTSMY